MVAKAPSIPYSAGRRTMVKVKHERTADVVVAGGRFVDANAERGTSGGGALVYAAQVHKDIWFVVSAGILKLPHAGPNDGASVTRLRADIVFARPAGRSFAVSIGNRSLRFGGSL